MQAPAPGFDERLNALVAPLSDAVAGAVFYSVSIGGTPVPLIVGWLIVAGSPRGRGLLGFDGEPGEQKVPAEKSRVEGGGQR